MPGILLSAMIYAAGSGLIEVLVSPIVEACPFDNKDSVMSLLHSFYCWGSVGVILLSTAFLAVFGMERWPILACIWAVLPLYNTFNFLSCPIESLTGSEEGLTIRQLCRLPIFWISLVLMVCAGASEISMAQWASAYAESALGLSKSIGDIAGPCLFAVMMGISRTFYGKYGEKIDLTKFMIASRYTLPDLLSGCSSRTISSFKSYRLRCVWFLCRNYVAGNHQYFIL